MCIQSYVGVVVSSAVSIGTDHDDTTNRLSDNLWSNTTQIDNLHTGKLQIWNRLRKFGVAYLCEQHQHT